MTDYDECDGDTNCFYTSGYSTAYYVEQYKNKLTGAGYGINIKASRLLTYAEATNSSIGCNESNYSCPTNSFITNISFWLGSACDSDSVWSVNSGGYFLHYSFYNDYDVGVRPVITISKSNL